MSVSPRLLPVMTLVEQVSHVPTSAVPVKVRFFNVVCQRVVDARNDRVDALIGGNFVREIAGIVDDIGVVAEASPDMVSAPRPPSSVLLPELPTMTLTRAFPVPLMFARFGEVQVLDIGSPAYR